MRAQRTVEGCCLIFGCACLVHMHVAIGMQQADAAPPDDKIMRTISLCGGLVLWAGSLLPVPLPRLLIVFCKLAAVAGHMGRHSPWLNAGATRLHGALDRGPGGVLADLARIIVGELPDCTSRPWTGPDSMCGPGGLLFISLLLGRGMPCELCCQAPPHVNKRTARAAGSRAGALALSALAWPLPLGLHLLIQALSVLLVRNSAQLCATPLLAGSVWSARFLDLHHWLAVLTRPGKT